MNNASQADRKTSTRLLSWIEKAGNRLPDPTSLFIFGTVIVLLVSQLVATLEWSVEKTVSADTITESLSTQVAPNKPATVTVKAVGLLSSDGLWWWISNIVKNFVSFPPLGLVLVCMLGIGLAERTGLISAIIRRSLHTIRPGLLTPMIVFLGIMSSLTLDAGYIVLPPLAAALYHAAGRPALAGLAAAFAGVSAGFSANFFITAIDPLLSGLTQLGAQILDPGYQVAVTSNWWFMIASTCLLTALGWLVTSRFVEPRLQQQLSAEEYTPPDTVNPDQDQENEIKGLIAASIITVGYLLLVLGFIFIPGAPLYGVGNRFDRWVEAMIPLLLFLFFLPGLTFGITVGKITNTKDFAELLGKTMAAMGPYIVLAFFASQFIACFGHSKLGEMLAIAGGQLLFQANLSTSLLIGTFILVVLFGNLFIGSASAKYAFLAPVFVPMFMMTGISPELTQAAYRVGDSVSNVISPMNPYIIVILAFMQRYAPKSGLGTLISLMLPYSIAFIIIWPSMLIIWLLSGIELGPGGPLQYSFTGL